MILRGDGKADLFQGNCFDPDLIETVSTPDNRADQSALFTTRRGFARIEFRREFAGYSCPGWKGRRGRANELRDRASSSSRAAFEKSYLIGGGDAAP